MTAEASIINEMSDFSQKSKSPIEKFFNRMPTKLQKFSKIAFPFLIQLSVMVLFSVVCPAFAKPAQKSFSKTASVTVKAPPLWKKILEGWEVTL